MKIAPSVPNAVAAEKAYMEAEFQSCPLAPAENLDGKSVPTNPAVLIPKPQDNSVLLTQEELITLKALFDIPQLEREHLYGANHIKTALKGQFFDVKG